MQEANMTPHFIPDITTEVAVPVDGTLSRKLYDNSIRLVAFAFDAGQQLTEHSTPRAVILQVQTGRMQVTAAGNSYEMTADSWLLLDQNEPHSVIAEEPSVLLLTLLG
jgi:quercetin dioxygenase-like cupin family protein